LFAVRRQELTGKNMASDSSFYDIIIRLY